MELEATEINLMRVEPPSSITTGSAILSTFLREFKRTKPHYYSSPQYAPSKMLAIQKRFDVGPLEVPRQRRVGPQSLQLNSSGTGRQMGGRCDAVARCSRNYQVSAPFRLPDSPRPKERSEEHTS